MENEPTKRERIELIVHDEPGSRPFEAPDGGYILTFPSGPDTFARRAVTALQAAEHANPDYAIELPKSRATTAMTTDGMALVAVWSDESYAFMGQTKEALQALQDALFPYPPEEMNLHELPPEAAALWDDILRMLEVAKRKAEDKIG